MELLPCVIPPARAGDGGVLSVGDPLLDAYLEFVAARSRPNTVLAVWFDLKVFFTVVDRPVVEVRPGDVLGFVAAQRTGCAHVTELVGSPVLVAEEAAGVSLRTVRRRLSTISGLYAFLAVRGDVATNPVPRELPTRREKTRPNQDVPLVRAPRTLPRVLSPGQVDALTAALRTHRDRAMVAAMLLGGLRRCEVLGLRLEDLRPGERQVFIADGTGGHQRFVPISPAFFVQVAAYLNDERPPEAANRVSVATRAPAVKSALVCRPGTGLPGRQQRRSPSARSMRSRRHRPAKRPR